MAIKIDIEFGSKVISRQFNEKAGFITGENTVVSGFDIALAPAKTGFKIKKGSALIEGALITETEDKSTVYELNGTELSGAEAFVYIEYIHEQKTVNFRVSATDPTAKNKLVIAKLFIKDKTIASVESYASYNPVNTIVGLAADNEAATVRTSIPSGFTTLAPIDFSKANNGNVTLRTESVAYVNGYKIDIPANTVIDVGEAPKSKPREDLVFLEAWKDKDFGKTGKLKWRIRHVAGVDFDKYPEGLGIYAYVSHKTEDTPVTPQGGNSVPLPIGAGSDWNKAFWRDGADYLGVLLNSSGRKRFGDKGLYVAGTGHPSNAVNTLDGWCYALPMFKLYRKPSCGKAIPFEYQKINPKVDYSKFANLMKEEKVERVISEKIGGRSLVNYVNSSLGKLTMKDMGTYWGATFPYLQGYNGVSENTTYTLVLDFELTNTNHAMIDSIMVGTSASISSASSNYRLNKLKPGKTITKFTTPADLVVKGQPFQFVVEKTNSTTQPNLIIKSCILLEGDWTNRSVPEHFTGLKSLGEDEEKLIEVTNSILNENSYDPATGAPKLSTVQGPNYITSDNLIIPTIEAQVKRGEVKVSDLTSFGKLDNLVGDETVEFTKIKGRTLQNLAIVTSRSDFNGTPPSVVEGNVIKLKANSTPQYVFLKKDRALLKPSTQYTIYLDIIKNTINEGGRFILFGGSGAFDGGITSVPAKTLQGTKFVRTTKKDLSDVSILHSLDAYLDVASVSGELHFRIMILEGDHSLTPLEQIPYVEGVKSVGENDNNKIIVKCTDGENLFNESEYDLSKLTNTDSNALNYTKIYTLKPNTTYYYSYTATCDSTSNDLKVGVNMRHSDFSYPDFYMPAEHYMLTIGRTVHKFTTGTRTDLVFNFSPNNAATNINYKITDIMLTEGKHDTYKPYKGYKQEITLKEPLRSLPNGVCDTIEGNKVIRRVGKVEFSKHPDLPLTYGGESSDTHVVGYLAWTNFAAMGLPIGTGVANSTLCSHFLLISKSLMNNIEGIGADFSGLNISKLKSSLGQSPESREVRYLKDYLINSNVIAYYQLATPIVEDIEPNYDKESIKTYQLDAPLRALPNGVYDEIVGNKLIRRCGEVVLDDSKDYRYTTLGDKDHIYTFDIPQDGISAHGRVLLCDKFTSSGKGWEMSPHSTITTSSNSMFQIGFNFTKGTYTVETFKAWLKANPVKIVYELETPIEIPLKEISAFKDNSEINTCCGSMYVGNGTNHVYVKNILKSDTIVANTPFRSITNKGVVANCRYKKHYDGQESHKIIAQGLNHWDNNSIRPQEGPVNYTIVGNNVVFSDTYERGVYETFDLKKGDIIHITGTVQNLWNIRIFSGLGNFEGQGVMNINCEPSTVAPMVVNQTYTAPTSGVYSVRPWITPSGRAALNEFMVRINPPTFDNPTYEPFIPTEKAFENIESNDIDDLRHQVSLTGFNYDNLLENSINALFKGNL